MSRMPLLSQNNQSRTWYRYTGATRTCKCHIMSNKRNHYQFPPLMLARIDAYYVFIHIYYPILPPPERLPVTNRPLNVKSPFQPTSPLSLAIAALLVLIPRPDVKQASEAEYTKLRRDLAQSFAQSALDAVEQDLELLDSSSDPSKALSEGAPQLNRPPLHSKLPVSLEAVLALVLLSTYEYAQRGNIRKLCNRAGQALTAAMSVSLHEMVEEDEFSEARKRAWWMTVCLRYFLCYYIVLGVFSTVVLTYFSTSRFAKDP